MGAAGLDPRESLTAAGSVPRAEAPNTFLIRQAQLGLLTLTIPHDPVFSNAHRVVRLAIGAFVTCAIGANRLKVKLKKKVLPRDWRLRERLCSRK